MRYGKLSYENQQFVIPKVLSVNPRLRLLCTGMSSGPCFLVKLCLANPEDGNAVWNQSECDRGVSVRVLDAYASETDARKSGWMAE